LKSKDQQLLEEAYLKVFESVSRDPEIGKKYTWTAGGSPKIVTVTDIREKENKGHVYSDGSEMSPYTSYSVEIEFTDSKGVHNKFFTSWAPSSFRPVTE